MRIRLVPRNSELGDLLSLAVVLLAAVTVRLAFLWGDPPIFLTTDSQTYAQPAIHLAHGQGFDLSLRRTPGYPLFLAALWAAFGDGAQPIVYAQHVLGVLTAGLTWLLGRLTFGRAAGLLGGLAVALSGPQILYEHYLMTESLFTFISVIGMLALVLALRRRSAPLYVVTGAIFGLAALARPVGQIFPLLVPLAAFAAGMRRGILPSFRHAIKAGLLALVGFALLTVPWMVRNQVVGGETTGSSALGKTLFGRITRHDDGFRFDLPPAGPGEGDSRRAQAREVARQAARDDTSRGSLVHERLMREFGYTEAQAYNVMRDVALEVILAQPEYYLRSSLGHVVELFLGQEEPLREHLERLANRRLRADWQQQPELAPLLPAPVTPEQRGQTLRSAITAVRIYQPGHDLVAPVLAALFVIGTLGILLRPAWHVALALPLLTAIIIVMSAFLDGPVPRFRYPVDPFIALTAGAGLLAAFDATRAAIMPRVQRRESRGAKRPLDSPEPTVQVRGAGLR